MSVSTELPGDPTEYPEPRALARAVRSHVPSNTIDGSAVEEVVTIDEYPDGWVRIAVEHYDGYRSIELDADAWAGLRAQIIENGEVAS